MKSLRQLLRLPMTTSSTLTQQQIIHSDPSSLVKAYFPFSTSFFGESMLQQIEIEKKMKSTMNLLKHDHSSLFQSDFYPFIQQEENAANALGIEQEQEQEEEEEVFTSPSTILHSHFTLPFHTMESCGIHVKEIFTAMETPNDNNIQVKESHVQEQVILNWNEDDDMEGNNQKNEILATSTLRKRRTKMNQHKYKKRMKAIRKRTKEKMN